MLLIAMDGDLVRIDFFRMPGFLISLGGAVIGFYCFFLAGRSFRPSISPSFMSPVRSGSAGPEDGGWPGKCRVIFDPVGVRLGQRLVLSVPGHGSIFEDH
jgi:hypothetical protein